MSNDEEADRTFLHLAYKTRPRRRIKASKGEYWQQDLTLLETRDLGLMCKECHKRIKWKDLDITYEMQGTDLIRIWWCSWCGTVVREDNITDMQMARDLEKYGEEPVEENRQQETMHQMQHASDRQSGPPVHQ